MTYRRCCQSLARLFLLVVFLTSLNTLVAATFVVTNTSDTGSGSLRSAMTAANQTPGPDTITFNIPGAGVQTIMPLSDLPAISERVTIDGTTQTNYAGTPLIVLRGGSGSTAYGLRLLSANCVVRGLTVNGFLFRGIQVSGASNIIESCFIGTDATGTQSRPNGIGILFSGGSNNCIGGPGAGNLISGNSDLGLCLLYSSGNVVQGNLIGTDITGTADLGNGNDGVSVDNAPNNTIGGTGVGERNVISGNNRDGIRIIDSPGSGNVIQGNLIGLNSVGLGAVGNGGAGINVFGGQQNTIGGTEPSSRNIISGNLTSGILIQQSSATGNVVQGNWIGLNIFGSNAVPNLDGIVVSATGNTIGGTEAGAGNVISGNMASGANLGGSGNVLQGNFVGTDSTGRYAVPNGTGLIISTLSGSGVVVSGFSQTIGGDVAEARNIVSGNFLSGVALDHADGCVVQGNWIGLDVSGQSLGNRGSGLVLSDSATNTIGGANPGEGNICSGNGNAGILLSGAGTMGNFLAGNYIGVGPDGRTARGNANAGVIIFSGPSVNFIGGSETGEGNVISGNAGAGLQISGTQSSLNIIQGNFIGLDFLGQLAVANGASGIDIAAPANLIQIGGNSPGEGNKIAFNGGNGVLVRSNASSITISANSIYGNSGLGINLQPSGESANTPTPNDPLDADSGPNHLQNFPVITNTVFTSGMTVISGYLRSTANADFDIEIFANDSLGYLGYGEGQTYLGTASASSDAAGFAEFQFVANGSFGNQLFAATATSLGGDTSEFSRAVPTMQGILRITDIHRSGADILISFTTMSGTNYAVEVSSNLTHSIMWNNVPGASSVPGNGNVVTIPHSSSASTSPHFYRVRQF